jgi:hypothetical protein
MAILCTIHIGQGSKPNWYSMKKAKASRYTQAENIEPSILLRVPKKKNAIWVRTFDIGRINFSKL